MRRLLLALGFVAIVGCARAPGAPPPPRTGGVATQSGGRCTQAASSTSAFELVVLGSGGPRSFGRAASGYLVLVDGAPRILVDVGPGASLRLGELGFDLEKLDTLLLTHLHIDHAGDVPGFVKARDLSFDQPIGFRIFGPGGAGDYPSTTAFVDRLFGTHGAFAYLPTFRNELRFKVVDLPTQPDAPIHTVLAEPGLRVTSIAVDHDDVPAVAFRIEHAGRAVVVTGDLASKNDNVSKLAAGADLLVYDAAVVDAPGSPSKLYDLHTAPRRIGEVAAQARVGSLLLSHVTPPVEEAEAAVLASVRASYRGHVQLAADCMRIDLANAVGAPR